ncbi:hypothetical protein ACYZUA_24240 [Pseudomonas sp. LS2P72]
MPEKTQISVGAELARDGGFTVNDDGECNGLIASKLGSYRVFTFGLNRGFVLREHEAFVMKLSGLRPNAACFKVCRVFSNFAKVRYQTQSFT